MAARVLRGGADDGRLVTDGADDGVGSNSGSSEALLSAISERCEGTLSAVEEHMAGIPESDAAS